MVPTRTAPCPVVIRLGVSAEPAGKGAAPVGIDGHRKNFMKILVGVIRRLGEPKERKKAVSKSSAFPAKESPQ